MDVDPRSFTVIVQSQDGPVGSCRGFPRIAAAGPTRLLVHSDPENRWERERLADEVVRELDRTGGSSEDCGGPCGFECFAVTEPGVRHLLVFVAGAAAPSPDAERFVEAWLARGWDAFGVFENGLNPDAVLPAALRHQHAPSWDGDVREVAGELLDELLLGGEERKVFLSYSHQDGTDTAMRVADVLTHLGFDVFLDRFTLTPGVDFLERINDELLDKSMVVVVETPAAVQSPWVRQEVATAAARRLGLAAVNLSGTSGVSEVAEQSRCRVDDDSAIGAFLLGQHRAQLRHRKESLLESVRLSLLRAGVPPGDLTPTAEGFVVDSGPRGYVLTVRPRPADLHRFRLAHERAGGHDAVVVHPTPVRADRRRDVEWLCVEADVVEVDEGLFDATADDIAAGLL
ncbi:toll/interleukin-1 receptor domain-containing protein [Lentzea sp.]|uniref:toll/interleukin-1 receptor domain-containing protein n=1 Tax=Lentzea sp. TaxID=56099 RepID=UPI002ED5C445